MVASVRLHGKRARKYLPRIPIETSRPGMERPGTTAVASTFPGAQAASLAPRRHFLATTKACSTTCAATAHSSVRARFPADLIGRAHRCSATSSIPIRTSSERRTTATICLEAASALRRRRPIPLFAPPPSARAPRPSTSAPTTACCMPSTPPIPRLTVAAPNYSLTFRMR